jgi:hypothetical protein
MSEFTGKVCPFCKAPIGENDDVVVCQVCGMPHHKGCWDENKGCTTFGCSEQHYEPHGTNISDVCAKCGTPLGDGQDFCSKCGTRKGAPAANVCGKCGATLQDGQEFCPKCGQKVGLVVDSAFAVKVGQFNTGVAKKNKKKMIIPIAIVVGLAIVIAAIVGIVKALPTVEKMVAVGNYEKAYDIAKDVDKDTVMQENAIAVVCALSADALKDRSSFELRDAYINDDYSKIVLQVAGKNSYGGIVTNYWYYTYDTDDKEFQLWTTYSDLEKEEYSKYDDTDEFLEKMLKNMGLDNVKTVIRSGHKLSKNSVKNINNLFTEELLDSVDLIDAVIDVERKSTSSD